MIGTRRPGADALDHLGAVHVGQAEIDDHQIDRPQRRRADRFGAGAGLVHDEAVEFETGAQEAADLNLVVDDEHDRGGLTHLRRFPFAGRRLASPGARSTPWCRGPDRR